MRLARCYAAYEYNEPRLEEPGQIVFKLFPSMAESVRWNFESSNNILLTAWPEVGSEAAPQVLATGRDICRGNWLLVQDGNYRFGLS